MSRTRPVDFWLFTLTVVLIVIGVLLVFDASYARAGQQGDSFFYLKRQAGFAAFGLILMLIGTRIRYWKLKPAAWPLYALSIGSLVLVLVIGEASYGSTRWIRLAGGLNFQPSEFAKLAVVLFLAGSLAAKGRNIRNLRWDFVLALLPLAPIGALIMMQPDMGTTFVVIATALVMVFMAGARKRHLVPMLALGMVLFMALAFSADYRRDRVMSFTDPFRDYYGSGYQLSQSLIALGSGGWFGVGLCEGREKLFYLPAEHTDFIFAILGEEFGLVGTLLLAFLFLGFGALGFSIASRTKDNFGSLLAGGISAMICGQALLNMLVVTASVPTTGVPLPFISYGGSSLALNLLSVGILLGISKYPAMGSVR